MTISKKKGAGNVYGRSLKSKSLFWSFYKFSNLFANPNALCSRVSQFITNFRFFYVFINMLHRKVLKEANFPWSLQNSWAEIEKYANSFARSCTKTVWDKKAIFLHQCYLVQVLQKVIHVYLIKKSNIDDIKLRKPLFMDFCKCAKTYKNHNLKKLSSYSKRTLSNWCKKCL